jgi:hypothetical protein
MQPFIEEKREEIAELCRKHQRTSGTFQPSGQFFRSIVNISRVVQ